MAESVWDEELCRRYAAELRPVIAFDHRRHARRIFRELGPFEGEATVVDLASGPGFLLIELGKLLGRRARLIAQDLAPPMLTIAAEGAEAAGLSVFETLCCPSEALDLEEGLADLVTCKQLLHEAADVEAVIGEATRVLKPGGVLYLIDFDASSPRPLARAMSLLLRRIGGRTVGEGFWESYSAALPGATVRSLALKAGCEQVEYRKDGFNYLVVGRKASAS